MTDQHQDAAVQVEDDDLDLDFDEAMREHSARPKRIRVAGRVVTVSAALPARAILMSARRRSKQLTNLDIATVVSDALGDQADEVFAALTMDQVVDLWTALMRLWSGDTPAPRGADADPPAPAGTTPSV